MLYRSSLRSKPQPAQRFSRLALCLQLGCAGLVALPLGYTSMAQAETAPQASTALMQFNIPAGPLAEVLNRFAADADIFISGQGELTQGKQSPGLHGQYSLDQGLQQILDGTGIRSVRSGNTVTLTNDEVMTLNPVQVGGNVIANDGSAENGYIATQNTNIGVWKGRTLQETPYTISVFSEELLQNVQATSTDEIYKKSPLIQMNRPQLQHDQPYVFSRGFLMGHSSRNGVTRGFYDHGISIEDVAKVEILTGSSGFLYGPGNVGGMVNYVSKRPTEERLNSVTVGNTSGSNVYIHGDFGGRFGSEGDFGYRLNVVEQDGDTAVEHQDLEKSLVSLALDWQVTDNLLLQIDGSTRDYRLNGLQAYWWLDNDAIRPDADDLDPDKLWSQKWAFQETQADRLGANLAWQINESISLRAGYLDEEIARRWSTTFNNITAADTYYQYETTTKNAPQVSTVKSGFVYFDVDFATGAIEHKLNIGLRKSDYAEKRYSDNSGGFFENPQQLPFSLPTYRDEPLWNAHGVQGSKTRYKGGTKSISIGDDIAFNKQWSALIGINHSSLYVQDFSSDQGDLTYDYDESAVTPTLSLIYKPIDNVTIYTTYMESFEAGGTASDFYNGAPVVNANQQMKPVFSEQIELGAKVDVGGMLLTAALFEIDKALEYHQLVNNGLQAEYVQDGRQVHRGIEFTATGKATDNLTLFGGFTALDAQTKALEGSPELEGKTPIDVAEKMFKLYSEYNMTAVPGLVLTGSYSYMGDFYGDSENTDKLDSYALIDIGARYQLGIADHELTLRFNLSNLTDERYWVNNVFLGDSRRISMSANIKF
ncbi:MAG: TonB-dependent receptor [Porticoccaceae bacterium]|nr:TonB-dependent receptor [Porticoccaceae bacterium]